MALGSSLSIIEMCEHSDESKISIHISITESGLSRNTNKN